MKAFLNRFNRGLSKDKSRDPKDAETSPSFHKEKLPPQFPKLPEWPPNQPQQPQRSSGTPSSFTSFKPLPDISSRPLPPIEEPLPAFPDYTSVASVPLRGPLSDVAEEDSIDATIVTRTMSPRVDPDSTGRSSRKTTNGSVNTGNGTTDIQKRVAFISPPPTPSGTAPIRSFSSDDPQPPAKSTISRFQTSHGKDPRGSTSTAASGSRTDVGSTRASNHTAKATSTRAAPSPFPGKSYGDAASIHQSMRSATPYSQKSAAASSVLPPASWSEGAEEDLVSNLGPRERTRQEVLWEIVASEERYVAELVKLKDTFIVPLLHPYATSPVASPTLGEFDDLPRYDSPLESLDHLPIASRFLSPTPFRSDTPTAIETASRKDDKDTPNLDSESMNSDDEDQDRMGKSYSESRQKSSNAAKLNHPRSPYGTTASRFGSKKPTVPFPSRSHQSLPPPARANPNASTHSLGRQSYVGPERDKDRRTTPTPTPSSRGLLRKSKKSLTKSDILSNGGVAPHQLPDDLRLCLEAIESRILEGHLKLSDGLRKRYEEQYPLVRSLADVFVANSHILRGYADYVLHLERALDQVEVLVNSSSPAKASKKQDVEQQQRISAFIRRLEIDAQEKGETGLAISLSKPFQRLLKYPLLFQNLLFHTDPSTFEYESTLQMVAEVETIVRSIEDEKIQKEERDKTRDVLARIEGLDRVRQLAAPKPSRVLVEEKMADPMRPSEMTKSSTPPPTGTNKAVKGKPSFKRFSDALQSTTNGKKDMWLVVFNDVVLRCQRTGTTSLPLGSAHTSRTNSMPELQGKSKYATNGRRNSHTRPRNLYKFVKIETWAIGDVAQPREGVVSMEEVVRSKQQAHSSVQPRIVPLPDDDEDRGIDSDDSDRKSKMSFSYWGADKITLQKPIVKTKQSVGGHGARRPGAPSPTGYSRESSANAKFGSRLVSAETPAPRPASRRTQATPVPRRPGPHSDEGHTVKVTVTRPDWNGSTRAASAAGAPLAAAGATTTTTTTTMKRSRNTSQTSAAARTTSTSKGLSSPAPSEDSGVGLHRQMGQDT
ncbi:Dbl domain-containing protein [Amylostereum chailletii]|nr:Dbl domain-containing protein [Amylostereum chailletii]